MQYTGCMIFFMSDSIDDQLPNENTSSYLTVLNSYNYHKPVTVKHLTFLVILLFIQTIGCMHAYALRRKSS